MAKIVSGFPALNTSGDTKDNYSLISILSSQIQAMLADVVEVNESSDAVAGQIILASSGEVADITITLPAAADNEGAQITVIKVDTGASTKKVILNGFEDETINGSATLELATQWTKSTVYCYDGAWYVIA